MTRCFILLLDSVGVGNAPDADKYDDKGADTVGHLVEWFTQHPRANNKIVPLRLPNMAALGYGAAAELSRGRKLAHPLGEEGIPKGAYGYATELSKGKDTLSGHWELMGVPVDFDWGYFPETVPCFPKELMDALIEKGRLPGVLGDKHASGTVIIQELGEEHCRSGKPIVYTSADSVLQIACHEKYFGLERLYDLCKIAYELVQPYHIARVIARPFVGEKAGEYVRTGNRHDYAVPAPEDTLLDVLMAAGGRVYGIGKIPDIFAHRGIFKGYHATGLQELFDTTLQAAAEAPDNSLIFTNFVDFDSSFGHRRDALGYGEGLEYVDSRIPDLAAVLRPDDVVLITADHGCDPTWKGTDHTREHIPVVFWGPGVRGGALEPMNGFTDVGQTIANLFGLKIKRGKAQKILREER